MKKYIIVFIFLLSLSKVSASNFQEMNYTDLDLPLSKIIEHYSLRDTLLVDLEKQLYDLDESTGKVKYNSNENKKEAAIKDLIELAQPTNVHITQDERIALIHLGKLAFNFLWGKKGLKQNGPEGIRLLKLYFHYGYSINSPRYFEILNEVSLNESFESLKAKLREVYDGRKQYPR